MNKIYFQAVHQIITAGHRVTDGVARELKEFGVSEPQYNVLRILYDQNDKPVTVQEIQKNMVQRTSNVTRIIDKLLDRSFVSRQECATNRRKMDISITKEGKQFLKKLDKKIHAFHEPMFENLSEKELKTLIELIKKLTEKQVVNE